MKILSLIPIRTKIGLLITAIVLLVVGYVLFTYLQPVCEPCLPNVKCPLCISKAQQVILFIGAFVALLLVAKSIVLTDSSPE